MYLAPLNYDRFFKKVFSDIQISKRFLEDFLDVEMESIEPLPTERKITDDATAVEFDFRCKIKGQYIIVDMQQWYKTDIIKRFYIYHSLNTALQLEGMPMKDLGDGEGEKQEKLQETKDYNRLEPVISLIWMADETLGFEENFVAYALAPEDLTNFVVGNTLWHDAKFAELMTERARILKQTRSFRS